MEQGHRSRCSPVVLPYLDVTHTCPSSILPSNHKCHALLGAATGQRVQARQPYDAAERDRVGAQPDGRVQRECEWGHDTAAPCGHQVPVLRVNGLTSCVSLDALHCVVTDMHAPLAKISSMTHRRSRS